MRPGDDPRNPKAGYNYIDVDRRVRHVFEVENQEYVWFLFHDSQDVKRCITLEKWREQVLRSYDSIGNSWRTVP